MENLVSISQNPCCPFLFLLILLTICSGTGTDLHTVFRMWGHLNLYNALTTFLRFVLSSHPKFLTLFLVLTTAEHWAGIFKELFTVNLTSLCLVDKS